MSAGIAKMRPLAPPTSYADKLEAYRRELLEHALWKHAGNRTHAARYLGLQRTYLGRLLRDRGITYPPGARG